MYFFEHSEGRTPCLPLPSKQTTCYGVSIKLAGRCWSSVQDQSAAPLQTRKIKVITLLRKTRAHLQVQSEVLSEGMGFQTVEEFNKGFFHMLPLTVTENMQGKRILEMRTI
ncbi:hypothetical protein JOQ06_007884 [Pogonophryne albipinna]|uniref:Uncharacterized protein n=1 Tax=Pogonophryne albipinna TaxID=1090488 RepID=A0AAD6AAL6_9TELE|nr:hypothetical protein JOQ06_007884 [Pogonophryne albipinna]